MAHPMRKHSRARRGKRRANWKLAAPSRTNCPQCTQPAISHRVCTKCGYYRGRQVIVIREKKEKAGKQTS